MNKTTKQIASLLDSQNKGGKIDFSLSGLNKDQIAMINNFAKAFNREGYVPFPMKIK